MEGIEDRHIKLDDGREVYRQFCEPTEFVYEKFVMSARQRIWIDQIGGGMELLEICYWGCIEAGYDREPAVPRRLRTPTIVIFGSRRGR